jgi:hypothetical protein
MVLREDVRIAGKNSREYHTLTCLDRDPKGLTCLDTLDVTLSEGDAARYGGKLVDKVITFEVVEFDRPEWAKRIRLSGNVCGVNGSGSGK